ncbi:MAG: NAD-dependent epimerase/dehydratase family protein [Deltaproteobacteria bacterium]|nr:NAD-dependent epimerase/dehydratase family protein [Deltaproteobacteria bacterium]
MNFLVLGGAGFIGSHVVDALLTAGHQVRVFERPGCDLANLTTVLGRIEICYGDFANVEEHAGVLAEALVGIDLVLHLVSTVLPASSNENPLYDIETNLKGTVSLLTLAVKQGVKKVVFASSGGQVYGPVSVLPIREESPAEPLSSYGIIKLAGEKYLRLFNHLHGLDYTVLRISNPYGERQKVSGAQGAVAVFLGRIKRGQALEIWGDGSVARDYLYIADLIKAILLACEIRTSEKLFNIGSGSPCTLNHLITLLEEVTGRKVTVGYKESRACDSSVNFLDCHRARKYLGWQPQCSLREGLERTWKWVVGNDE